MTDLSVKLDDARKAIMSAEREAARSHTTDREGGKMTDKGKLLIVGFVAIVLVLVANAYGAHAVTHGNGHWDNARIVAHHCLTEDDWGYVGLRDYSATRIVLKCGKH